MCSATQRRDPPSGPIRILLAGAQSPLLARSPPPAGAMADAPRATRATAVAGLDVDAWLATQPPVDEHAATALRRASPEIQAVALLILVGWWLVTCAIRFSDCGPVG